MKKKSKIILSVAAVIVIITSVAAIFWFKMPIEQRNMITFMMIKGESYENYQEYQVIDRNDEALVPTSFKPNVADIVDGNNDINIVAITEMVKNENSSMMKKGMIQSTGIDDYTVWYIIADEVENPFGPSPLSYYTGGLAANLHTQILKAAEVKEVELDNVKVHTCPK